MKYVIAGNGIAGISAAEVIRQLDPDGNITIIGDETVLPYSRPMISMVLEGAIPFERLPIRSSGFYDDLRIHTILGKRISGIEPDHRRVLLPHQDAIEFDRLLIATGADARPVAAQGNAPGNIFCMRTESHVRQITEVLPYIQKPLVLGGGLVGFKAAYGLLKRGFKPTMLISSAYPLSMQVDETAGKIILDKLLHHGLNVRVGVSVMAFEGRTTVEGALLSDGSSLPCDLTIVGKGVQPALDFVPPDSLAIDAGILVNDAMETSQPGIFAAGDAAQCRDITRNVPWVNAIWPEAAMQGRIAGANMAGRKVLHSGSLGRNVMRIFDLDLLTLGLADPAPDSRCRILTSHDRRNKTYRKLVFREEKLVGAILLNHIEQGGILSALIRNETPITIPEKKLLEPTFNFRQLMR